ncbi:exodeoxyribonuclease III [Candidatus Haliotispira prima]|uniref:Exodeoxyribonuclease III n=1 Tax=Candidatus Haliotispira prima TaxID=3034016 RepID=A0ABY8MI40_9SPIO|nr:exodeoxyribonuclease III [Candidatus Haliotispira prima]
MATLQSRHLISWNVNGIRAIHKKGLLNPLFSGDWDIIALQETKVNRDQLGPEYTERPGYRSYWSDAERKGYSGTALFIKEDLARNASISRMVDVIGENIFDAEGRSLIADFNSFVLVNCYFPNSQEKGRRIDYKLAFNRTIHRCCEELSRNHSRPVLLCGDYNVAVREIDLARPDDNHQSPGFLPKEREWMEHFMADGYTDSFRHFYPDKTDAYSWWSYRTRARERNVGWRIDYFCINSPFARQLEDAAILDQAIGSDHCPVCVTAQL